MMARIQKNILAGIMAIVPIGLTIWILGAIINVLTSIGRPFVMTLGRWLEPYVPWFAKWIEASWAQSMMAICIILVGIYVLGVTATAVVGMKLLGVIDRLIERIPFVQLIHGSARKLISALQERPADLQRVVLIEFPSPDMKAIGLVTRTFTDARSGRQLAAVYVPTTPNPTSGYIELVPIDKLVSLDWTPHEAMSFIISGGAVGPEQIDFEGNIPKIEPRI
jgi:uncharacterized membrane protein